MNSWGKNLNLQGPVKLKQKKITCHKMLCSVELKNQTKPLLHQRSCGLKCTENKKIITELQHQTEFLCRKYSFLCLWQTAKVVSLWEVWNSNTATKPTIFLPAYIYLRTAVLQKIKNKIKSGGLPKARCHQSSPF